MATAVSSTAVRLGSIMSSLFRAGIETDVHKYGYRVANTHPLFASASGEFPMARSLIANTVQLATGPQETDVATRFLTAMHAPGAQ